MGKVKSKKLFTEIKQEGFKKKRDLSFYGTFFLSKLLIKSFLINYL